MTDTTTTRPRAGQPTLTERQSATVDALVSAAERAVREVGYDEVTLREVATRAGVTHTTAYAYFSSKAHLLTEVFRRRLESLPEPTADPDRPLAERVAEALSGPSLLLADDPAIAQAALPALLASDPEVARLRTEIGAYLAERVRLASGDDTDPAMTETILLVFSGAMLQAGMGYFDYDGVVLRVVRTAEMLTTQSGLRHPRAATE